MKNLTFGICISLFLCIWPSMLTDQIILVKSNHFIGYAWEEDQVTENPSAPNAANITTQGTKYVELVCGPNNPRRAELRLGCVLLSLPTSDDTPTSVLRRVRLRNNEYSGIYVRQIHDLKYSTYIEKNREQSSPVLVLQIDNTGDDRADYNVFFDPTIQFGRVPDFPAVANQTWQEWDAMKGQWQGQGASIPGALGSQPFTLATLASVDPRGRIINTSTGTNPGGGIRFTVGGDDTYKGFYGYIDAFTIGIRPLNPDGSVRVNERPKVKVYDFDCQ